MRSNTGLAATYYWGNVPAVDLLNLSMNEGEAYSDPLALLLCGVGDPRNVLLTIASLPDACKQKVTFVSKRHLSMHSGQNNHASLHAI